MSYKNIEAKSLWIFNDNTGPGIREISNTDISLSFCYDPMVIIIKMTAAIDIYLKQKRPPVVDMVNDIRLGSTSIHIAQYAQY